MPLARAPMLFVTVAQEKRDFKIFVILITAWSRVQVLDGPTKKSFCRKVEAFFIKKAMQDLKGRPSESEVMNSPVDCSLVRGCWAPGWPTKEKLLP